MITIVVQHFKVSARKRVLIAVIASYLTTKDATITKNDLFQIYVVDFWVVTTFNDARE